MKEVEQLSDGARDFDFVIGRWHTVNQRRLTSLQGKDEWETFESTEEARQLPAGIGNYDDFHPISWRPGFVAMSLRIFNPETKLWSIYWLDNKTGGMDKTGSLLAPVVGKFTNGVGIFEGDDIWDNKPVRVRYTWSVLAADNATWEQALSTDGGKTWETNWIARHSRVRD
ncbi:hypothetical protein SAMN04515620_102175 [Collimonas sp. OK607]|uniref:hypothetical protein n=1 Tax=Collimonas sp. OK607 TaxID=1798194 RepID=UPI0008E424B5|nr:hypothetical protein [Collimonas sp. OK607]SFA75963.1 hypothetical protein SAMN04515620_102175 [Collimonas sp. OK607]